MRDVQKKFLAVRRSLSASYTGEAGIVFSRVWPCVFVCVCPHTKKIKKLYTDLKLIHLIRASKFLNK